MRALLGISRTTFLCWDFLYAWKVKGRSSRLSLLIFHSKWSTRSRYVEKEKKLSPTFARPWADVVISLWYLTGFNTLRTNGEKADGPLGQFGSEMGSPFVFFFFFFCWLLSFKMLGNLFHLFLSFFSGHGRTCLWKKKTLPFVFHRPLSPSRWCGALEISEW